MNRMLVLFIVGLVFGAAGYALQQISGFPNISEFYVSAFGFGLGVVAALIAIFLADHLKEHQTTLRSQH